MRTKYVKCFSVETSCYQLVLYCTVPRADSTANDPETANDPQNGPQMILDRK